MNIQDHNYGEHNTRALVNPSTANTQHWSKDLTCLQQKGAQLRASHSHYEMCVVVFHCRVVWMKRSVLCCAVLRRRNKVPVPA